MFSDLHGHSAAAPGEPGSWPRPSTSFKPTRSQDEKGSRRCHTLSLLLQMAASGHSPIEIDSPCCNALTRLNPQRMWLPGFDFRPVVAARQPSIRWGRYWIF